MIVENNWLTTNIKDRVDNKNIDFSVNITPYSYEKTDFKTACISAANKIAALNRPIYISLSGGADSEYVVRVFKQLNIPFTALTVETYGNYYELMYANLLYKEFPEINKVYIDLKDRKEYLKKYIRVVKTTKTLAVNSIPLLVAAEYVKAQNNNGILISGDHSGECGYNKTTGIMLVGYNEWDYYTDIFVDDNMLIPFYQYDLNIVNSMVEKFGKMTYEEYKQMMYGTLFRPKFNYHFKRGFNDVIEVIRNKIKNSPKSQVTFNKNQFLSMING